MPVLFDVNGDFASSMNALQHWHIILSYENEIVWRRQFGPGDRDFESEVGALLP